MDILLLEPTLKETIWGGRKLIDDYGFETTLANAAEAWLLSCHKDGPSFVTNGEFKGKTLQEVIDIQGRELLGTNNADINDFPILIKIIDACDKLSVQVHPADEYARAVENENGKTEAWFVLDCEEGAELIFGVNRDMEREEFAAKIEDGSLMDVMNCVKVKPGDVIFIPSGMLHAIGAGILLAEVQQSSNTTYRVFDYNRKDKFGNTRELHIKKATDVVNLEFTEADFSPKGEKLMLGESAKTMLCECEYFSMTSLEVNGEITDNADEKSFVSLLVLDGNGTVCASGKEYSIKKGSSVFIPASTGEYKLNGNMKILESRT